MNIELTMKCDSCEEEAPKVIKADEVRRTFLRGTFCDSCNKPTRPTSARYV